MSKTIFITGASRGLGRIWAEAFLKRGDNVIVAVRNPKAMDELLQTYPSSLLTLKVDVTKRDLCFGAVAEAVKKFGHIDTLINNAGYCQSAAVEELTEEEAKILAGDRGYRGHKTAKVLENTQVVIPSNPKKTDSYHIKKKKRRLFNLRASIEPIIGHLKSDHRLGRNFYKGTIGDAINVMLAAAAFNFKRAMNALFHLFFIQKIDNFFFYC